MFTEKLEDLSIKLTEETDRRLKLQYEMDKVANLVTQVWLLAVVSSTVYLGRVMLTCCLWWVYSYERNECVSACEIQGSHSTEYEVCWDVTAFSLVDTCWHFGGIAASIFKVDRGFSETLVHHVFTHSLDHALWYTCLIKTNKTHFSFLIYSNNLSCTCFEQSNCSSWGCSYCMCSIRYLPHICFD